MIFVCLSVCVFERRVLFCYFVVIIILSFSLESEESFFFFFLNSQECDGYVGFGLREGASPSPRGSFWC